MGGIGKTSLGIKVGKLLQSQFDFVIWRSLRNTPAPEKILAELIQFLSEQKETNLPQTLEDKISLLLKYLRSRRCLLILDNIESILQPSNSYLANFSFECRQTFTGHTNWVRTVATHPQKNIIASGSDDGTIRLWDINTGKCLQVLTGHKSWIRTVAFSSIAPGGIIASGSGDSTVKLWDVNSGKCLRTLAQHSQSIYSVAISNYDKLIASGSGDNTVRIWDYQDTAIGFLLLSLVLIIKL